MCAMVKSRYIGDGHPTFNTNPYNGYINPYYWVDDHPRSKGNNGSLDPGTCGNPSFSLGPLCPLQRNPAMFHWRTHFIKCRGAQVGGDQGSQSLQGIGRIGSNHFGHLRSAAQLGGKI